MLDALEPYALQKVFAGTVWWHLQVLRGGGFAVFSGAGTFLTWRCGPCEKGIPASLHLQPEVEYNVYIYIVPAGVMVVVGHTQENTNSHVTCKVKTVKKAQLQCHL